MYLDGRQQMSPVYLWAFPGFDYFYHWKKKYQDYWWIFSQSNCASTTKGLSTEDAVFQCGMDTSHDSYHFACKLMGPFIQGVFCHLKIGVEKKLMHDFQIGRYIRTRVDVCRPTSSLKSVTSSFHETSLWEQMQHTRGKLTTVFRNPIQPGSGAVWGMRCAFGQRSNLKASESKATDFLRSRKITRRT